MSAAQENRDLVVGAIKSALAGDLDTFLAAMSPDVQVHEPGYLPYGGLHTGTAGFLRVFEGAGKVLDLGKVEFLSATADEERVVLMMTIPLASTGEPMRITEHWCVEQGQITDVRVFWFEHPETF